MIPVRTAFAAALLGVGTAAPAWAGSIFTGSTGQSDFNAITVDNALLDLGSVDPGQYGTNDLDGSFGGFPGGGPSDPDAADYVASEVQITGSSTTAPAADPDITITAAVTAGSGGDVFFVLDNPNDKNDVDSFNNGNVSGDDEAEGDPYVSFYGPSGAQLIFDFDPGISAFAFESFDLAEGAIEVLWQDGSTTDMEMISSGTFVGIADPSLTIDQVTVTTMTNQGVALNNIQTAVAVPSPVAALTALPILGGVVLMRLRRA